MALLCDDLLYISRITLGRLQLSREPMDLAFLVTAAVETVRPAIEEKHQILAVDLPNERISVEVDALRLSQCISNLLANVIKFTPPDGRISLNVAMIAGELTITMPDTGVEGAKFSIVWPAEAPTPTLQSKAARTKVLVADDNRDAADTLGLLLEFAGHDVIVAHSGTEALELGRLRRPDVFILDIGMPDISGYDVARAIRTQAWGKSAYLLAITGWGQPEDKDRARDAGFDHHLIKPVDPDAVEKILKTFRESATRPHDSA
jgi:CheY-like chemotaxis protein